MINDLIGTFSVYLTTQETIEITFTDVMQKPDGEPLFLVSKSGTMYNWHNIVRMTRVW